MMIDIQVFTTQECTEIVSRLERLRPKWLTRQRGFATFGVATYLDVMCSNCPDETYYRRLSVWNKLLMQEFGEELERIGTVLSQQLKAPTRYESAVALPGFHIFEDGGLCTMEQPSMHFDLQHRSLRWPFGPISDEVISFTVTIKLPHLGGGLDIWDVMEEDITRLERLGRRITMEQLGQLKPVRRHKYYIGIMALQLKPMMHRISAIQERFPGDQRITLQGHGVREQDSWVLYW
jgi:hypothetical protein